MSDLPIYACSSQNSMNIWVLSLQQKHYCTTCIIQNENEMISRYFDFPNRHQTHSIHQL